jgi:site-specific DNA-methyltransferase (adenine-specific)
LKTIQVGKATLIHGDCMEYMSTLKDKEFDLAVVDPPYGIGDRLSNGGGKLKNTPMATLYRESSKWDVIPTAEYFIELFRGSKNQIICGANYFLENLPSSRGCIAWDKKQTMPTLSSWEFLWSSFDRPAKTFYGVSTDLNRFHPTQKPVKLYEWILANYAKPGQRILDTHGGSMSSVIAALNLGFEIVCIEKDEDYFNAAVERVIKSQQQQRMFE